MSDMNPKPCPFCGENMIWKEEYGYFQHPWLGKQFQNCILSYVGYENAGVIISPDDVEDWNRRAAE